MKRVLMPALAAVAVAGCSQEAAAPPAEMNVCHRVLEVIDGEPQVQVVARNVPNLESCAVRIEGLRMIEGRPATGVYNAHFIFATETALTSALSLDGARVRVFEEEQRVRFQEELRERIAAREAGTAADVRQGQRTVVVPPPIVEP